jgi:hypothetical protein
LDWISSKCCYCRHEFFRLVILRMLSTFYMGYIYLKMIIYSSFEFWNVSFHCFLRHGCMDSWGSIISVVDLVFLNIVSVLHIISMSITFGLFRIFRIGMQDFIYMVLTCPHSSE